jgi:peptide/nickel transport system permease protein
LLSIIAVAAPFLANNRPLVLRGEYRGLYRDRFEEWKLGGHPELTTMVPQGKATAAEFSVKLATVERELSYLASQLRPEDARVLTDYLEEYREIAYRAPGGGSAAETDARRLDVIAQEISGKFNPDRVVLQEKMYWPVFSQLTVVNVLFLALAGMVVIVVVARRFLPPGLTESWRDNWMANIGAVVVPALLIAGLWALRPAVFDTMDYKQDLFNGRIQASLALFPPIAYGINEGHLSDKYLPPSGRYWMGSDGNGRDVLTRMIWGSQISLSVGFVAVAIYVTIGIIVGTIAGYFRGWVDMALSRLIEIVICFPAFFLILAVLAFLRPSILNIMVVIGITGWTTEARLVRGEFLRLNNQEFVVAAKGLGVSDARIIFRHILPNGLAPLLVSASFGVASAILIESSLSFLGFGISIPVPSWGGILNEARENFRYWWITIFPGLAIFATVTAYNLLGEGVRDAIDPRMKL